MTDHTTEQPSTPPVARRLSFEVSAEIPGTPEEIWQAVATGPGVSLWFMRMEIEEFVGGRVVADQDQPVPAKVTVWEPPHRFAYEYPEAAGPHAWEYTIEAKDGGVCTLRLVDSCFVKEGDFAGEIPTDAAGWKWAFDFLVQHRIHFPNQPGSSIQAMWPVAGSFAEAWIAFQNAMGLPDPQPGRDVALAAPQGPILSGRVISFDGRALILKTDQPAPGLAWLATGGANETHTNMMVHLNLFGPDADEIAAREEPRWFAWLAQQFPMPEPAAAEA